MNVVNIIVEKTELMVSVLGKAKKENQCLLGKTGCL
jgi:hypothetical protein